MYKKYKKVNHNEQKGQALLFVIVALSIALTVGVSVSSRTLSSIRRTTTTDSATRVLAAAEGGVEWFLRQPHSVLAAMADGDLQNGADCPTGTTWDSTKPQACVLSYEPQDNDNIQSRALVSISEFSFNHETPGEQHYWFSLDPGDIKEVTLKNYRDGTFYRGPIDICWKSRNNLQSTAIYYSTYSINGVNEKNLVAPRTIVGAFEVNGEDNATPPSGAQSALGYDSCQRITINTDLDGLRIKTLYETAKVGIFGNTATFPAQGFKITSLGEINNVAEKVKAIRVMNAYRSLPYAPGAFDYSIYSAQPLN